jgi:hypothetical protein
VIADSKEGSPVLSPGHALRQRFGGRALLSLAFFLIIPILFVISASQLTKAKGPQWLPYAFENPYIYLLNSLLVVDGRAPQYIDHPGTTTEMFGAIILRVSSLKTAEDLIASALRNPEKQIKKLHWALLTFSALILWIVPWFIAVALRSHVTGLLIQAPCLFFKTLLFYGSFFGSDLMVVPFSIAAVCCCLLLLLVPSLVPEKLEVWFGIRLSSPTPNPPRLLRVPVLLLPALIGLVCALGIVTKLTFFPLVLISLLCCRSRRNLLAFSISFIFGLTFALLPIYSQLPRLVTWTFNLGIHSERYDRGAIGLPQSSVYLSSLSDLLKTEPLVVVIPTIATIVLLAFSLFSRKPQTNRITWSTVLGLFAIQVISLLLIAKEIGPHYLIPLSITTGLNLVFLFQTCRRIDGSKLKKAAGWIVLVGLLALGGKSSVEGTLEKYAELTKYKNELLRLYWRADEMTKNDVRVDYFFSDSPEYPLCYANNYASRAFGQRLAGIYPNALFLNIFAAKFETFTGFIEPKQVLQKYDHLYFLGNLKWFPRVEGLDPATFETIDHAGEYYLQKWTRK